MKWGDGSMSRKLFFQKLESIDNIDYCLETLLPDIPFYGTKGTICRIEVLKDVDDNRELFYYKVLYNHDGSINPDKIRVSKRHFALLVKDYYSDLKKYLDLNNDKYLVYKTERSANFLDKNKIQLQFVVSMILTAIGIPILISTTYIGAIIEAIFILLFYTTYDKKKKISESDAKTNFIKEYDEYQKKLVNYNLNIANKDNIINKTAYTCISTKKPSYNEEFTKARTKILIKEEKLEVA